MNKGRKGSVSPGRNGAAWAARRLGFGLGSGGSAESPVTTDDSPRPPPGGLGRRDPKPPPHPPRGGRGGRPGPGIGVGRAWGFSCDACDAGRGAGSSPCRPAFGRLPAGTARRSVCAYGRRRLGSRDRTRLVHSHVTVTRCDGARDGDEQYVSPPIKLLGGVTVTIAEEVRAAYAALAAQTGSYVVARAVVVQRYGLTASQANRYLPR